MNTTVYVKDIVHIGDIAKREHVSKAAVQGWMRRPGFPEPVAHLEAGAVYDYSQVRRWREERGK